MYITLANQNKVVIRRLLERGPSIDKRFIPYLFGRPDPEIIRLFPKHGFGLNSLNQHGISPLS